MFDRLELAAAQRNNLQTDRVAAAAGSMDRPGVFALQGEIGIGLLAACRGVTAGRKQQPAGPKHFQLTHTLPPPLKVACRENAPKHTSAAVRSPRPECCKSRLSGRKIAPSRFQCHGLPSNV